MATYQYRLTFIPKEFALKNRLILDQNSELFDKIVNDSWEEKEIVFKEYETFLNSFTNPIEWSKKYPNSKDYGNNDTDDLSIYLTDKGYISEFTSRFDLRQINKPFIDNVFNLASQFNSLALDEKGNLFEVNYSEFIQNIQDSNAFKFVQNPTAFLSQMSNEN